MHALVRDAGAIKRVKIIDSDFGQSAEWKVNKKMAEINHTFWASPWGANLGANITVKAWDVRENRIEINKTILGPVGQTIEELWSLLPVWLRHGLQRLAREAESALGCFIDWIKGLFMGVVNKIVSIIVSVGRSLMLSYGMLLLSIAYATKGNETNGSQNNTALIESITNFVKSVLQLQWILIGSFLAVMGVMLVIKAASLGIEQVVETTLFAATKGLVTTLLVGLLIPRLWESVSKLANKKDVNLSYTWNFVLNYLGITVSYGATIVSIIETIADYIESESFSWFFAGLTLAVGGFFLDAATSAVNLTGGWLQAADLAGVLISGGGLLIMILAEFLPNKKDTTESAIETVSPLLSILQWIIAIGGFAKAILDYYGDQSTGWSG